MVDKDHDKRVQFVQECVENLTNVSFSEVDSNLEEFRIRLLRGFQNLHCLIGAPLLFQKSLNPIKKSYAKFLQALQTTTYEEVSMNYSR
jgi:lipoate-protein ligase A